MSSSTQLIPVNPAAIRHDRPLPYTIFNAEGVTIALRGAHIDAPDKLALLRQQGWRLNEFDDDPAQASAKPQPTADEQCRLIARFVPIEKSTALIADDMQLARTLLSCILSEQGIAKIIAVEDGKHAISRFFIDDPHLVFLDIDMPQYDGLYALKQIKGWCPECFVCLVSANSTRENVHLAREHGADGFVVKPYSALNLVRILERYQMRIETP